MTAGSECLMIGGSLSMAVCILSSVQGLRSSQGQLGIARLDHRGKVPHKGRDKELWEEIENSSLNKAAAEFWAFLDAIVKGEGVRTVCVGGFRLGHALMHIGAFKSLLFIVVCAGI